MTVTPPMNSAPEVLTAPEPAEPTREDVERLVDQALTAPTVRSLEQFVDFASRFRKLAAYNLYMVYIQRPGASAVATRDEWAAVGQRVLADAIPIVILRTFGPIDLVYELSDTVPPQTRDPRVDMFGAEGPFDEGQLYRLIRALRGPKRKLQIDVVEGNYGSRLAGTATSAVPMLPGVHHLASGTLATGQVAHGNFETQIAPSPKIAYRIKLNRRMAPAERFATLAHELGHIFCGHLGGFSPTGRANDESGWPDRRALQHSAREIEAEIVAWLVTSRANLITGAPLYLKPHLLKAEGDGTIGTVKPDMIVRAVARIEKLMRG